VRNQPRESGVRELGDACVSLPVRGIRIGWARSRRSALRRVNAPCPRAAICRARQQMAARRVAGLLNRAARGRDFALND
jgi:hypothetical protein